MGIRNIALAGMMAASLSLTGCKTCDCFDSWCGGEENTPPTTQAYKPLPTARTLPASSATSPTQNMQLANTPPAQWNNAPAKLAMPQNSDAQVRVTTPAAPTMNAPTPPPAPVEGAGRSNWSPAANSGVTPVSATAPAVPQMSDVDTMGRRSVTIPTAPASAMERQVIEVPAQQPAAAAVPETPAPTPTETVAPFGTPRGEN